MSDRPEYLQSADEVDMEAQEQGIRTAGWISTVILACGVAAGYYLLPRIFEFPTELVDRMAFAAKASIFVLVWVLIGVMMVSTGRRRSPKDIGGSAAAPPSDEIAVYVAFLQNSLEQAVLAVGAYWALSALVKGPWLSVIVVGVVFFTVGRILFLAGYKKSARGRALGMTLTMLPTLAGYALAIILMGRGLF